jgi:hypothetical protein
MDDGCASGSLLSSHNIVLPRDSMHDFTTNKRGRGKKKLKRSKKHFQIP